MAVLLIRTDKLSCINICVIIIIITIIKTFEHIFDLAWFSASFMSNNIIFPNWIGHRCNNRVKWQDIKRQDFIGYG